VGYDGNIFKTTSGGIITSLKNSIIYNSDYLLEQNFPNPFNPHTKIKFSIPKRELVSLKIYDITGREVKTLVKEVLEAGVHVYNFNPENLSSGAYFYRLETNNYTSIRKMIFIK